MACSPWKALRLRNKLGKHHDLEVLAERIEGPSSALSLSTVVPLARLRQGALERSAVRLAGVLFAERPQAFRRRVSGYLRA